MPKFNPIRIWLWCTTSTLIGIATVAVMYAGDSLTHASNGIASNDIATAERNDARLRLLGTCYDHSLNCFCYGATLSSSLGREEIDALLSTGNLPVSAAAKRAEAMRKCPNIPIAPEYIPRVYR